MYLGLMVDCEKPLRWRRWRDGRGTVEGQWRDSGGTVEGLTVTGRIWSWLDNLSLFKKLLAIVSEEQQTLVFPP